MSQDNPKKKIVSVKHKSKASIMVALVAPVVLALCLGSSYFFRLPVGDIAKEVPVGSTTEKFDKFDILLLGTDGRAETDYTHRTDTMILASMDTETMEAKLLTIPRDTRVKYGERWMRINAVYGVDGAEGSVKAVEELLGTKIDRYAVVDFNGVIELVDLMGGIEVDVAKRMYKPLENINIKKGPQHLDGAQTLGYMRYRDGTLSDFDRSERQKEVIIQLVTKLLTPSNILKLPEIVDVALRNMETNLSNQEIISFIKYGSDFLKQGIESQLLPGTGQYINGIWYYIANVEELNKLQDLEVSSQLDTNP